MKKLLSILLASLLSCSGAQITITPDNVLTGAYVGIAVAQATLPQVETILDARPEISGDAKASIHQSFLVASESLTEAATLLHAYDASRTVQNQCRVHFALDQAITAALQGVQIAKDALARVPSVDPLIFTGIAVGLGELAALDDMLYPACNTAPISTHASTRVSAQQRVRAAFSR